MKYNVSILIEGPLRHTRRCVNGKHVTGGDCGHVGGILIDGSCFVRTERRRSVTPYALVGGSGVKWVRD